MWQGRRGDPSPYAHLKGLAQRFGKSAYGNFVAAVPAPLPLFRCLDQSGLLQNPHVVGDGGLGNVDALLDVTGAQTSLFPK